MPSTIKTLKETRVEAGLTLKELADRTGLTWSTIQAIEQGRTPGSWTARMKLADALHIPIRYLLTEVENEAIQIWLRDGSSRKARQPRSSSKAATK